MAEIHRVRVHVLVDTVVEFERGVQDTETIAELKAAAKQTATAVMDAALRYAAMHRRGIDLKLDPSVRDRIDTSVAAVSTGNIAIS